MHIECTVMFKISHIPISAVMSEWLRRQTRNLLGSARAGSNPAGCGRFELLCGKPPFIAA